MDCTLFVSYKLLVNYVGFHDSKDIHTLNSDLHSSKNVTDQNLYLKVGSPVSKPSAFPANSGFRLKIVIHTVSYLDGILHC